MILVSMGQHDSEQVLAFLLEKGDVGHDEVDARQMILIAKRDAEIDRHEAALMAVADTVDRQVHADLADTAEWCESEFVGPRHHAAPVTPLAAPPKKTSPELTGTRLPLAVVTIR